MNKDAKEHVRENGENESRDKNGSRNKKGIKM